MNYTHRRRLQTVLLAALAAGGLTMTTRAASLVAFWDFEKVEADGVSIKANTGNYTGLIEGSAVLTDNGLGRPQGGGRGFSVGAANPGKLLIDTDANGGENPMTAASAEDSMTVVLWQKNDSNINSSSMWARGPAGDRGFQFHVPWSDGTIYFDTAGGCCSAGQRVSANVVATFPEHDWTAWHHYAFVKNGGAKAIYIDGKLLIEQAEGADVLPTEWNRLSIGGADSGGTPDAVIDDFAIFKGALTEAQIKALAVGGSPGLPPTDTDGDGMPDNWETQYGFNINSAADAALDFDGDGATNLAEFQAGTDPTDITKPVLVSAVATASFNTVVVTFSENVDPVSAGALANYSISPSLAITAATVNKKVVTLTTAAQTPGATKYTLTVNGVLDGSKNAVAANSTSVFYSYVLLTQGALKTSIYTGIAGNAVQGLLDDPKYIAGTPDRVGAVFSLNSRDILPTDSLEAYGGVMEGFLTPAESGDYNFFLRSDDGGQFAISTDENPANLSVIALEEDCCDPFYEPADGDPSTSTAISLVGGKKYYIQAIWKEGGGGDYGQVAWRKSTDTTPAASLQPIPGTFLSTAAGAPFAPEGAFVTQSPAPNSKGVSPAAKVVIAHRDGKTAWTAANVSLKFDGSAVTPVVAKDGSILTINYNPGVLFESGSVHTIELGYLDAGGNPSTTTWSFTAGTYNGTTADKVAGYPGLLLQSAVFTADALGHTGQAGDKAVDTTTKGGPVAVYNDTFLAGVNAATANDELSVSFWQKKHDTADSSAFTVHSPTTGNNRTFHAHVPWSNQNVYFDTTGCCDGTTQRITADINTFPDYTTGDPRDNLWWTTQWHHWVFTKQGSAKNIFVDGKLFLSGDSTGVMATDNIAFYMGSGAGGTEQSHALIDDFAIFGKALTEADALALKNGTLPTALPAAKGLIAYWDYNATAVVTPTISIGSDGKITYTGTLHSADNVAGPYAPVVGATSPFTPNTAAAAQKFYRSGN